ncbi:MAG: PH domain-containing protein [[Clostridium] scindens]
MGILASILVMATVFMSALWDIIKGFVKYYDFKVKRIEDRLYIRYGFLKKVNYTIPVDKINALKLTQSLLGRMSHRYMAEIVNVGMGDDEAGEAVLPAALQ